MKIAVIGGGISGLAAAYLLQPHHDVTLYESAARLGGHSRTVDVPDPSQPGGTFPVDSGFIVLNDRNYPNLLGLFAQLNIPIEKSNMSFGVSIDAGWLEYSSRHIFAQSRNIFRPRFWRMLFDILRFNRRAAAYIGKDPAITLGQCLDELGMGPWFRRYFLLAMGASIWSSPRAAVARFPARTFVEFFRNHGLLTVNKHPQWYTVTGGSRVYVDKISRILGQSIRLGCKVKRVAVHAGHKTVKVSEDSGATAVFDQVILACHADQALAMIAEPNAQERRILNCFTYRDNVVVMHEDRRFMPENAKAWASWVYLSPHRTAGADSQAVSLSYWMNNLQNLDRSRTIIVTLNPGQRPREDCIIDEHVFAHPVFDAPAIAAQKEIPSIQGQRGLWFCGAYQGYGFHEDGLLSAMRVAQDLGATIPWAIGPDRDDGETG